MTASHRYLIIGLGNPGGRYAKTRHNLGFEILDTFAEKHSWEFRKSQKVLGDLAKGSLDGKDILLLKPCDYINNSGKAARAAVNYYKIPKSHLLVVVDDAMIQFGSLRMKESGSSGGHNGLKDIEAQLGTNEYIRLRLGIGHPGDQMELDRHVLGRFTAKEERDLPQFTTRAVEALETWIESGIKIAMNIANQRPSETLPKGEVGDKKNEAN